jgi:ATP-dependent protease ClpP protease subunit
MARSGWVQMQNSVNKLLHSKWHEHDNRLRQAVDLRRTPNLLYEETLFDLMPKMSNTDPNLEASGAQTDVFYRHQQAYDKLKSEFVTHFPPFYKAHEQEFIGWVRRGELHGKELVEAGPERLSDPTFWIKNHIWLGVARMAAADRYRGDKLHAAWEEFHEGNHNVLLVGGGFDDRLCEGQEADLARCRGSSKLTYLLVDSPGGFVSACDRMAAMRDASGRIFVGIVPNGAAAYSCGALTAQDKKKATLVGKNALLMIHQVRQSMPDGTLSIHQLQKIVAGLMRSAERVEETYVTGSYESKWEYAWGGGDEDVGKERWARFVTKNMCKWKDVRSVYDRRMRGVSDPLSVEEYLMVKLKQAIEQNGIYDFVMWANDNYDDYKMPGHHWAMLNGWQARYVSLVD